MPGFLPQELVLEYFPPLEFQGSLLASMISKTAGEGLFRQTSDATYVLNTELTATSVVLSRIPVLNANMNAGGGFRLEGVMTATMNTYAAGPGCRIVIKWILTHPIKSLRWFLRR